MPDTQYWRFISGKLCDSAALLYGSTGDAGHTGEDFPIMNPGSNNN